MNQKYNFTDPAHRSKAMRARNDVYKRMRDLGIPSILKSIRLYCLDCTGGSKRDVRMCPISQCPMWPYRFGRQPKEQDIRVPCFDSDRKFCGYRDYKGYPQEVDGMPSPDDAVAGDKTYESDR